MKNGVFIFRNTKSFSELVHIKDIEILESYINMKKVENFISENSGLISIVKWIVGVIVTFIVWYLTSNNS